MQAPVVIGTRPVLPHMQNSKNLDCWKKVSKNVKNLIINCRFLLGGQMVCLYITPTSTLYNVTSWLYITCKLTSILWNNTFHMNFNKKLEMKKNCISHLKSIYNQLIKLLFGSKIFDGGGYVILRSIFQRYTTLDAMLISVTSWICRKLNLPSKNTRRNAGSLTDQNGKFWISLFQRNIIILNKGTYAGYKEQ